MEQCPVAGWLKASQNLFEAGDFKLKHKNYEKRAPKPDANPTLCQNVS
jgi:hypothetical protein